MKTRKLTPAQKRQKFVEAARELYEILRLVGETHEGAVKVVRREWRLGRGGRR